MSDLSTLLTPVERAVYVRGSDPADQRLADVVRCHAAGEAALTPADRVIIGFPQDEGVRRNLGRVGTAAGPNEIRRALGRFVAPEAARIVDLGDVRCDTDLEASQERLGRVAAAVLEAGAFPIVLGGGHELAYGHFLGYANLRRPTGIINVDAHLDVRPLRDGRPHSGCPFRQAIEHPSGVCTGPRYVCLGIQRQSNSPLLLRFMDEHHAVYHTLEECTGDHLLEHALRESRRIRAETAGLMLTVDLDSVRAADAPGVSAPSPVGFYADQVLHVVQELLRERLLTSLDVAEVNPQFDLDHRTARLAALFVYQSIAI